MNDAAIYALQLKVEALAEKVRGIAGYREPDNKAIAEACDELDEISAKLDEYRA